jgi:hypothetical protein
MLSSLSVVEPLYPPTAVLGGTVVAELHFDVSHIFILSAKPKKI